MVSKKKSKLPKEVKKGIEKGLDIPIGVFTLIITALGAWLVVGVVKDYISNLFNDNPIYLFVLGITLIAMGSIIVREFTKVIKGGSSKLLDKL